jgi:hypothetical protein
VLKVPFPAVVLAAALIGRAGGSAPAQFARGGGHGGARKATGRR